MARGWRKQVLATGKVGHHGVNSRTFDEFCEEQRVRLVNELRPPIRETGSDLEYEDGIHPRARENEYLTRAQVHRLCEQTIRGRV